MPQAKPIDEIRIGKIQAAIWRNETEHGPMHNVTLERIYRDGDQWKATGSLGRDDLLTAAKVLDLAHTRICELIASEKQRDNSGSHKPQKVQSTR